MRMRIRTIGHKENELKAEINLDEVTVSRVLPEHRYNPAGDLFVS